MILMGMTSFASRALAQFGQDDLDEIEGGVEGDVDVKQTLIDVLQFVLSFLALLAIIFIIVAGIRLIVSQGEEEQKDKAKKTILYVIIGLLVILFAKVIVSFFVDTVPELSA